MAPIRFGLVEGLPAMLGCRASGAREDDRKWVGQGMACYEQSHSRARGRKSGRRCARARERLPERFEAVSRWDRRCKQLVVAARALDEWMLSSPAKRAVGSKMGWASACVRAWHGVEGCGLQDRTMAQRLGGQVVGWGIGRKMDGWLVVLGPGVGGPEFE